MRILAVDVGTGTQDILLYDTALQPENCFKLVMPSPTMRVARQVKEATRRGGQPLLLTGVTMGGGPSHWAVRDHAAAGNAVFATPDAARTFDDNLDSVREMGVEVVSEDEAARLAQTRADLLHLQLRDFDYQMIARAFAAFGLDLALDGAAVAVFDHGAAPPGTSDRQFRFDYLDGRIRAHNRLSAFAFPAHSIPPIMTRLAAVAASAWQTGLPDVPLMVMDTAPAAVLGAILDPMVGRRSRVLVTNVGNFHTLAFRLGPGGIEGVFEHHTGEIDVRKLEALIAALADGTLRHEDVFGDHGHGALVYDTRAVALDLVGVTGPRRSLMHDSQLPTYFAVPYGDMMLAGCFGMVRAWADVFPEDREPILDSLGGAGRGAPWELL